MRCLHARLRPPLRPLLRPLFRRWGLAAMLTALGSAPVWADGPDLLEQGRRIYQQGLLGSGQALQASGAGGVTLVGQAAACVQCHRRSGMGSREGSLAIPAIAGPLLFRAPVSQWSLRATATGLPVTASRQATRAAYDDATLARALRHGQDANARSLDVLMPRYALAEADVRALTAYLHQLSATPVPGLQDGVLQLATIISPDADPLRAAALRRTLAAWVASGPLGGMPLALQVWQLQGPASGWQQQLQDYQRQRPVYAVLSGAGRAEWTPVRDFCEQAALPCLFPLVDLAPSAATDFYTLYGSRGVPIEAQMLARHLHEQEVPVPRLVQLFADEAGRGAAALLEQALADPNTVPNTTPGTAPNTPVNVAPGSPQLLLRPWQPGHTAALLADVRPDDFLVLWLRPAELAQLLQDWPDGPASAQVYVSAQLAPPDALALPAAWRPKVRWVSAHADPERLYGRAVLGLLPWAAQLKIDWDGRALLADLYACTYFFADALARMRGHWSQDYLMETLENANFNRPAGAAYFSLSLAAGQREAAKGGHLLGYATADDGAVRPLGPRITP